jgi:hypothetical protein
LNARSTGSLLHTPSDSKLSKKSAPLSLAPRWPGKAHPKMIPAEITDPGAAERRASDGPFCWQSKRARRRIREAFDSTNNVTTALGVYDALCEIASDKQAETFATTHAWIQRISGVGVTTIKKHLAVFSELKLVNVSTPAIRAASTYTLLSISDGHPTSNDSQPTANDSQWAKIGGLARSEESQKNLRTISKKAPPDVVSAPGSSDSPVEPAITAEAIYAAYPRHQKRAAGLRAIINAMKKVSPDLLLATTQAYAKAVSSWPEEEKKFIPFPASWFNGGCFDDDQNLWVRGQKPVTTSYVSAEPANFR